MLSSIAPTARCASDGDNEGGDACDITVTYPLNGDIRCSDPPPIIRWSPEIYNQFKVFVGSDAAFSAKITSGKKFLTTTSWVVPRKKWAGICAKANANLYLRVLGKISGTKTQETSETVTLGL